MSAGIWPSRNNNELAEEKFLLNDCYKWDSNHVAPPASCPSIDRTNNEREEVVGEKFSQSTVTLDAIDFDCVSPRTQNLLNCVAYVVTHSEVLP